MIRIDVARERDREIKNYERVDKSISLKAYKGIFLGGKLKKKIQKMTRNVGKNGRERTI